MLEYSNGTRMRGGTRVAHACSSCNARKIRCDLFARGGPPCTRCEDAALQCNMMTRRRRPIRAVETIPREPSEQAEESIQTIASPSSASNPDPAEFFLSLGPGDQPRRVDVNGLHDISKQKTILVDFLSQDFTNSDISDYQPTFIDDYANITRLLGREFGRGFQEGVYHYRDAPFVERSYEGIPKTTTTAERLVLDRYGAFVLPSPNITDAFTTAFFDRVFPSMPILDRSLFLKHLHGRGEDQNRPSLLLIQSIILAGSTVYHHPDIQLLPDEVASRLHARAKALIDTKFEQDRLVLAQAHLLISSFTADSCDDTIHNMWLSLGTAVRIAQGIGMHRDLGRASANASMRRQWRRMWWTLFIHDTICSFEWGRPRAIHLADTDVPPPNETDFRSDDPGSLPCTEHIQFFLSLNKLCFIIADWLDLLRPRGTNWGRGNPNSYEDQVISIRKALDDWTADLPLSMVPPRDFKGFTLWTATLHIAFYSVILRLYASLSGDSAAQTVHEAALKILLIGLDLAANDLLGSLWGFGIHQFDLSMGQHARETRSEDRNLATVAFESLRQGIPLMQQLCQRSSTAAQGLAFYEALLEKREILEGSEKLHQDQTLCVDSDSTFSDSRASMSWAIDLSSNSLADSGVLDWNAQWAC